MSESPYRICILGGGIAGLTTSCYLLKTYSSSSVILTVISDQYSPNLTSDKAAGYWHSPETDPRRTWALHSYDIFLAESFSVKSSYAGVMTSAAYILHGSEGKYKDGYQPNDNPSFSTHVKHFHQLAKDELQMFADLNPLSGYSFTTAIVEVTKYLQYLRLYLKHLKVEFTQQRVNNLHELSKFDLIINCTGLASKELEPVNDQTLYGVRGQVLRVSAPWIKSVYLWDSGLYYIIPQTDLCVLGGTSEFENESTDVDEKQTRNIIDTCAIIHPSLKNAEIKQIDVGFRPARKINGILTVRVEYECIQGPAQLHVIHNYGHGGNGVTLSWGCAREVVDIIRCQRLLPNSIEKNHVDNLPEHEQLWQLIHKE